MFIKLLLVHHCAATDLAKEGRHTRWHCIVPSKPGGVQVGVPGKLAPSQGHTHCLWDLVEPHAGCDAVVGIAVADAGREVDDGGIRQRVPVP